MTKDDKDLVWDEIINMLRVDLDLPDLQFNTWIDPLNPIKLKDNVLIVSAPSDFIKNMIEKRYLNSLEKYLKFLLKDDSCKIRIINKDSPEYEKIVYKKNIDKSGQVFVDYPNKEDLSVREDEGVKYQSSPEKAEKKLGGEIEKRENKNELMLNKKYTFSNFVKGKSNEFALACAQAVANNPANIYNPLFIYGAAGLGKTHLMQAIAHRILENNPSSKILYLTSEQFTNELIASMGNKEKNVSFRDKYRNIDVLLIDDIQFIAGKEATQEEFFHTFNALYGQNKQIVISSDRPPKEIRTLEERLQSRFSWGITADIQHPDFETRMAILQHKMRSEGVDIPNDAVEYIAQNVKTNIRELEGALLNVIAYSHLKREEISLDLTKEALKNTIKDQEKKPITIDGIKKIVGEKYGLKEEDFTSKNRSNAIAFPRQIAMYLVRILTDTSYVRIGNAFNRDHTTAIHGIDKIQNKINTDQSFKTEIDELIKEIKGD